MTDLHPVSIGSTIDRNRCIVCVGPGGVGKTSTAAAMAMYAAAQGKRTVVLTIDPAKRLANAMGLTEIGSVERPVPDAAFEQAGLVPPSGRLTAMMLDIKQAWDEVVLKYHPDEERRRRLLDNRLYRAMSSALAGSQEYMAMEKLHALATRTDDPLDVIVLDTPPANHAVDFLEAPSRIVNALDNDATRWLVEPYRVHGRLSRRLFDAGSSFFIRSIGRFIGTEMLEDLADLLLSFQGMFDGFRDRAAAVDALLAAPDTAFVVVSTPSPAGVGDAEAFLSRLDARSLQVSAVVFNRTTVDPWPSPPPKIEVLRQTLASVARREPDQSEGDLAERLYAAAAADHDRARSEQGAISALAARFPNISMVSVPELAEDVHDLRGLGEMRNALGPG